MRDVYTIEDLRNWGGVEVDPPIRLAVFGDPVAHSKSPQLHNPALRHCGIPITYARIHILEADLPEALQLLKANKFVGVNLTIPHKTAALKLVDYLDPQAAQLGAVNTVLFEESGAAGFNTDGPGIVRAIRSEFGVDLSDLRIMILGAGGGAGRAIAAQCGIEQCERLVLVNRTHEKSLQLAKELTALFVTERLSGSTERLATIPWERRALERELNQTDLVINASAVGMKRSDPSPLPADLIQPYLLVYDTIYGQAKSRLILEAEQAGARAANGLSLLLHQGALAFEIWFNRTAPLEVMKEGLESAAI